MQQKPPFLSRLLSRLFFEILPAGIVSTVVGLLFNQVARPPAVAPVAVVSTPIGTDKVIELLHDEQTLLADYLNKQDGARPQPIAAAAQDTRLPTRQAAVESKASVAFRTPPKSRHLAARAASPRASEEPVRPVQIAVAAPVQPAASPVAQPLSIAAPAANAAVASRSDNVVMAKLRGVAETVEQVPEWVRSAGEWFSDTTPPRPPADLPARNFMRAAM